MSNEKERPVLLFRGYVGDEILPSYVKKYDKTIIQIPIETTSIYSWKVRVFSCKSSILDSLYPALRQARTCVGLKLLKLCGSHLSCREMWILSCILFVAGDVFTDSTIPFWIHGTILYFTYRYHQNQPFMQVNIQSSHGSVVGMVKDRSSPLFETFSKKIRKSK